MTLARLDRASVRRGEAMVLHEVDFELRPGDRVAVLGENGSGKTTLLRLLMGLQPPSSGSAQAVPRGCGYVPQAVENSLFPWRSVVDNVAMPALLAGLPRAVSNAQKLLELVVPGVDPSRLAGGLSGGEQQAVAIARALNAPGPAVLADEPFSAMSAPTRALVCGALETLLEGRAFVFVTHAGDDVVALGARVVQLTCGKLQRGP
ncbi:MAG: ATP-binding cassette domain-containing protein [Myxococcales bacterium]|nr:ATP-binding cassette domain-containing protein [Myxococcales bacterium]